MKLVEFKMLRAGQLYDNIWEEVFSQLRKYFNDSWEIEDNDKTLDFGFPLPDVTTIDWERTCIQNYIIAKLGIPEFIGKKLFYITRDHESSYHNKLKTSINLIIKNPDDILKYELSGTDVFYNYEKIKEYIDEKAEWFFKLKEFKKELFPITILN